MAVVAFKNERIKEKEASERSFSKLVHFSRNFISFLKDDWLRGLLFSYFTMIQQISFADDLEKVERLENSQRQR